VRVPAAAFAGGRQAGGRPVRRFDGTPPRRAAGRAYPPSPPPAGPQPQPDYAGAGLELWQRASEAMGQLIGGSPPAGRVVEPAAVIAPSRPPAVPAARGAQRPPVLGLLAGRRRQAEPHWPGAVPTAVRWCAACRAERTRTAARYQAELAVAPFAADLCGTCLGRLWREVPAAVVVARRLPALSKRAAEPAEDALLRRLAAAGLRVPGLAGLVLA
jgi:hypothetical protein